MSLILLDSAYNIGSTLTYKEKIYNAVGNTLTYNWPIYNAVGNTLIYNWPIWGYVGNTMPMNWAIFGYVGKTLPYGWVIAGGISDVHADINLISSPRNTEVIQGDNIYKTGSHAKWKMN